MDTLKSIEDINCETREGKLALFLLGYISTTEGFTDKEPDEVLKHFMDIYEENLDVFEDQTIK